MMNPITVYAINLPERTDRLKSIKKQFSGRKEFCVSIMSPVRHKTGAFGHWQTFVNVVKCEATKNSDFFIFCEDDHVFTRNYDFNTLAGCILEADKLGADILCGGVGYLKNPIQCSEHLFWLDAFNGTQFTIIFNRFYDKIIMADTDGCHITDNYISEISDSIFVLYPFISRQKEFGYSDITEGNGQKGHIGKCFRHSEKVIKRIVNVKCFYNTLL